MVLEQACSNYPLCSPYRGSLFTGRYAFAHGVVDNECRFLHGQVTLPQVLGQAGYRTAFIGKWHLGYPPYPEPKRYGFDTLAAYNCGYGFSEVKYYRNEQGPQTFGPWSSQGETDLAIQFLQAQHDEAAKQPWAMFIGWAPPHWPYDQCPEAFKAYRPEDIDLPPNVPKPLAPAARQNLAGYYALVTALDDQFGRLMATLDRLGMAQDTIVVFTSDHGDHIWSHGFGYPWDSWLPPSRRGSKATPYEVSIGVPFVVRYPGHVPAGARSKTLVGTVDIMPSLLHLCDLEIPSMVQGIDLSHVLLGQQGATPDSLYLMNMGVGWPDRTEWMGFWRGVRTDRWTYARWLGDTQPRLLFDIQADPHQLKNLAGQDAHADIQRQLEARLSQWIAQTADPFQTGPRHPTTGVLQLGQEYDSDRWKAPK
jgi:arylsulfatase A-like enzyme